MSGSLKTAIVTGASQGIGAGIVKGLVERGFNVVANSRKMTQSILRMCGSLPGAS
jgi:NAD(P)-dependent dehydrogenase (short-subunit alcohol dehydrogenase family)